MILQLLLRLVPYSALVLWLDGNKWGLGWKRRNRIKTGIGWNCCWASAHRYLNFTKILHELGSFSFPLLISCFVSKESSFEIRWSYLFIMFRKLLNYASLILLVFRLTWPLSYFSLMIRQNLFVVYRKRVLTTVGTDAWLFYQYYFFLMDFC